MAVGEKAVRVDGAFFGWLDGPEDEAVLLATLRNQEPAATVATDGEPVTPDGEDEPPIDCQMVTA